MDKVKRRIAVVIGSATDLPQCSAGLVVLKAARAAGEIELVGNVIYISSIHRNQDETLALVDQWAAMENGPDVIITGAGWANHLSGVIASRLRYELKNDKITVIAAAFKDLSGSPDAEVHDWAAWNSIVNVPGADKIMVYEFGGVPFIGHNGFEKACRFAVYADLPEIELPKGKNAFLVSLEDAISNAQGTEL